MRLRFSPLLATLALVACAQPPYVPDEAPVVEYDDGAYLAAAAAGLPVYRIDPAGSGVYIRVGRAGALKSAGHDHAIASTVVEGMLLIAEEWTESRADLRIPLVHLVVDDPANRARFGLDEEVSESAINGTTRNMQEKVLESATYPSAIATARLTGPLSANPDLAITLTLRDVTAEYTVPCELQVGPEEIWVSGALTVQHEDFGLEPFSAAGGLLRVADQIDLEFEFRARRWGTLN
jgi:polyisoprenoid-binding protein YceI